MKLKVSALAIAVLLFSFASIGCGNQSARILREGVETISQKSDDVTRKTATNVDQIPTPVRRSGTQLTENQANELINYIKKEVEGCAKGTGKTVIKQTITNAINSNLSQISVDGLLEIALNEIQECSLYKLGSSLSEAGESVYAAFKEEVSEAVVSLVMEAEKEYEAQILFVSN